MLDANVSGVIYAYLKSKGYDVLFAPISLGRLSNGELAHYAIDQGYVILTHDRTFHESVAIETPALVKRLKLVILNISPGAVETCIRLLDQLLETALDLVEESGIVMTTPEGVRVLEGSVGSNPTPGANTGGRSAGMAGSTVGLHIYAATVKNLRGVLFSSLGAPELREKLSWLRRRFRYRNLGLTPDMISRYGEVLGAYAGRTFMELGDPDPSLRDLLSLYEDLTGLSRPVLEAYCYASAYVSPVLALGERSVEELRPLVLDQVMVGRGLSDRDYKLHMRIADYTVLDFYPWSTASAMRALELLAEGTAPDEVMADRREKVGEDKRRYWRISAEEGRPFLLYLDLLPILLAEAGRDGAREIVSSYGRIAPATLAIISAVVL